MYSEGAYLRSLIQIKIFTLKNALKFPFPRTQVTFVNISFEWNGQKSLKPDGM